MKKTKNKKPRCSEETDYEAGRESMVGKICEKGRSSWSFAEVFTWK